ncbi:hypothetical protein OH77DRAFT_1449501 [Trametes cingulata]|nr:hypothetical protein OH77DRAFT_1449501 [Trametes cingulata]
MSGLPIYTALSLPSVSISPSAKSLRFSQDGQAILLTKHAVYILTPDAGVNVELSSVMKQTLDSKLPPGSTSPLGWLRTMVEFDRSTMHQWPTDCQDWGSVCLGSLDPTLQALALSPSHLTASGGCLLALLNSNLELTIWGAPKNFLTGEWIKASSLQSHLLPLQDVTSVLKTAALQGSGSVLLRTLQAQSMCIEWTPQPDWGLTPAPFIDASLLAVGNRAGSVTLLRFDRATCGMVVVDSAPVADRWVTHLAWSAWTDCHDSACEAMLACGAADGSVTVYNIRQTLTSKSSPANISSDHEVNVSVWRGDGSICEADGRAVTAMAWANRPGCNPILIFHKAGTLHVWSAQSQSGQQGSKTLVLRTQRRSLGSSALCVASGICYVPNLDSCIVSLSDGSFHVIHRLSIDPTLDPLIPDNVSSDALSAVSRRVFLHTETEDVTSRDVDRINGMVSYDANSTFAWTYEATRPTDFSYKHDAKHVSSLVVAQLWAENVDEQIIHELAERVRRPQHGLGEAPVSQLRAILLHLRDAQRLARLHTRILDILYQPVVAEAVPDFVIPTYEGDWGVELSRDFVRSLTTHLFGWSSVQSQRIRHAVAAFCQGYCAAGEVRQRFAETVNHNATTIRTHIVFTVLRHLSAVKRALKPGDIYFARRTIRLATLPGTPSALVKEAGELSCQLPLSANAEATADSQDSLDELCPACHASVPLQDAESAVCCNGHVWDRCCVTSLILATPMVRTCVGCSRKAFVPAPSEGAPVHDARWLPDSARGSWVLRDLLDATRRCPFCGNNFVTLV